MLPILRIVPVGGVLLAILILVLALTPPDGARAPFAQRLVLERGPLLDRDDHPEWRQLLIRAALRRADEINRLRELPDTPTRTVVVAPVGELPSAPTVEPPKASPAETWSAPPHETQTAPASETESKPEPQAGPVPQAEAHTTPELKTASVPAKAAASDPVADEGLAREQAEPAPATVATIEPAAPVPAPRPLPEPSPPVAVEAPPPASEPAHAATSTPTETDTHNQPTVTPAAPAPAIIAKPPEPAVSPGKSEPRSGETIASIDARSQPSGANTISAPSPVEMPVVLPQRRPAAADAPHAAKPTHRVRRRRVSRVEASAARRTLSFFDLLFNTGTTSNAQATPNQLPSQPTAARTTARSNANNGIQNGPNSATNNVAKNTATSDGPFSRDFGAYSN